MIRKLFYGFVGILLLGCSPRVYQLAYASDREGNLDVYLTNSAKGDITPLTRSELTEYNLSWTGDGREIYYTQYSPTGRSINYIDLTTKSRKTVIGDSTILSVSDVSHNNLSLIISTKEHHPKGELYLYDRTNQSRRRLTNNEFFEAGAKFSPDEKTIVASIQTQAGDTVNHSGIAEIFIIRVDDLEILQLTQLKGFSGLPDFSPNGKYIAFHKCNGGNCDIYRMNADGSKVVNLTKGADDSRWPRWSPDGKWIAFTRTKDKNSDIYFVSKDGKISKPVIATQYRDEVAIFKPES